MLVAGVIQSLHEPKRCSQRWLVDRERRAR